MVSMKVAADHETSVEFFLCTIQLYQE